MRLDFMTPEVWDGLVLGVVVIGLAFAVLRLYRDLSRPAPRPPSAPTEKQPENKTDDHPQASSRRDNP